MKRLLLTTAAVSITLAAAPAFASTEDGIKALQEQMMQMMARVEALEKENKKLRSEAAGTSGNLVSPALEARVDALEKENQILRSSVSDQVSLNTLPPPPPILSEHGEITAASTETAVTAADVASIEPAAGGSDLMIGDTRIKFGGYAKADFIYDDNGYGADFVNFSSIPLDGSSAEDRDGDFHAHARQTRLNVSSVTPTSIGDVKVFAEIDFFGTRGSELITNNHAPELRQAYGQVGGVLAGQAWTNFVDLAAWPDSLDFRGIAGTTVMRQTQLRYSGELDDGLTYAVSLENPNSDFRNGGGNTVVTDEQFPDLVGAITKKGDWGHASLRGVAREIAIQDQTLGQEESEFAYGLSLTSKLNVGEKDNFKFRVTYGDGIGRYLYDVATNGQGAAYDNGELKTQEAWGGYAAYQHHWTDTLRSNIMGGYVHVDNETDLIGTAFNQEMWSGHLKLIWKPVKNYQVGVEYIHAERELDSGTEGDVDRIQASFIYNFN